jgi:class 3 adenylate cyclase/predicted ATPase
MTGIEDWLDARGLSKYISLFSQQLIDLDVLPTLTDDDLRQLGVPLGDRKRILNAVGAPHTPAPLIPARRAVTEPAADESAGTSAERRQVTVVFCDLANSTDLVFRLDPEELAGVMGAYQGCCEEVVSRWGGHLAEFLGDGAVVYFGWPTAHEDDAERAVRCALELTSAVGRLSIAGAALSARAGISTGLVVVGEIKHQLLTRRDGAVGGTVNVAARLQALAAPGTVAITHRTRQLIGDRFDLESLGQQTLKGMSTPVEAWTVKGVLAGKSRFDARGGSRVSALVGRDVETATLLKAWGRVADSGKAALITGEPGIGKSRLVQVLSEQTGNASGTHIALQCSPYHLNTALQPFVAWLRQSTGIALETDPERWVDRMVAYLQDLEFAPQETVPLLATLLSAPDDSRYAAPRPSPQLQRDRTIRLIIDLIERVARNGPVLMVVEDLQWADPTTQELLRRLIDELGTIRVFLVMTARPEFDSTFGGDAVEHIALNQLAPLSMLSMVEELTGHKVVPETALASVLTAAGGIPLFVEELVRSLLESNTLRDLGDRYELTSANADLAVPATLHDLLVSRLDRLPSGKVVARVAATLGSSFSLELLSRVIRSPPDQLRDELRQLCEAGILQTLPGHGDLETYGFRHALLREAAYRSQLNSRRQHVHMTVANVLEQQYPRVVQSEPEVLAHHFAEGGSPELASEYLLQAGRKALQSGATREAITHLSTGLRLVLSVPRSLRRDRTQLRLQATLGTAYMQARGWAAAEVETAYVAAAALSGVAETAAEEIWVLWGTWVYYQVRGRIDDALAASERIQTRAHRDDAVESLLIADMIALQVSLYAGRFPSSVQHCNAFKRRYDAERHRQLTDQYSIDLEVVSDVHESIVHWILGHPDRAVATARRAHALATELGHPYSLAWCCTWGAMVALLAGDMPNLSASLETGMAIAEENGYAYVTAMGRTISGWIVGHDRDPAAGAAIMGDGLAQFRATGAEIASPFFETLQAELLIRYGDYGQALELLRRAKGQIDRWGERWQEAEVYRVEGNALAALQPGCPACVEWSYRRAIAISSEQGARTWHLRACADFALALRNTRRVSEAKALLQPVMAEVSGFGSTREAERATLIWTSLTAPDASWERQ